MPLTYRKAERPRTDEVVGSFHRFGENGIAYEVIGLDKAEHVRIRVLETGETLSYPAADVRLDPEA